MTELGVVQYESRDGQQITLSWEIIKRYLVAGKSELVTRQELMYFMGTCKSRGLNPFIKDCYLIKYDHNPAAIITSIDFFRKRARAQKDCKGWRKGVILMRGKDIIYSDGLMLPDDVLLGGWFEAKPEGWDTPFRHEVNLAGYIKRKSDGSITKFWSKENQPSQIAKVAESQGLRILWPDEFQDLYTPEEMGESEQFKAAEEAVAMPSEEDLKKTPENKAVYEAEDLTGPPPSVDRPPPSPPKKKEPEPKKEPDPEPEVTEQSIYDKVKDEIGRFRSQKSMEAWVIDNVQLIGDMQKAEKDSGLGKAWDYFNEKWQYIFGAYYCDEGQPGYVKPPSGPEDLPEELKDGPPPWEPPPPVEFEPEEKPGMNDEARRRVDFLEKVKKIRAAMIDHPSGDGGMKYTGCLKAFKIKSVNDIPEDPIDEGTFIQELNQVLSDMGD